MAAAEEDVLSLLPLIGPPVQVFTVSASPAIIGRAATCEVSLLDDSVSRRHATLLRRRGEWFVIDERSAGGTIVNGAKLEPVRPVPLGTGDLLRIGPWVFRVVVGAAGVAPVPTLDDSATSGGRVRRPGVDQGMRSERRLGLLTECIARLNESEDEESAASAVLDSALIGSGYARGAVLALTGDGGPSAAVRILAARRADPADTEEFTFSRSLIEQANAGEPVMLASGGSSGADHGQSIAEMNIHSALCVPVGLSGSVTGYLYFDARGQESRVRSDAAAFCECLAIAFGLAVANVTRGRLERREAELHSQLHAAREVQQLVAPPEVGSVGCVTYAARSLPGSFVAGDLFDVVNVQGDGVAVCLGDVSGHGVGAAMLMAVVQAFLGAELRRLAPDAGPLEAIRALNGYLCERSLAGRFVSLWVGVLSPDGTLEYVDAGHGHWVHLDSRGGLIAGAETGEDGNIPLGIDAGAVYRSARVTVKPGERVLVYSDGIIEQRGADGEDFGMARLLRATHRSRTPADDILRLFEALGDFMKSPVLDDDATAASIGLTEDCQ